MTTSLLEALLPVLAPLAAGGAHYLTNDTQPTAADGAGYAKPYIVFTDIVSSDNVTLSGATNTQNTLLQVDIFAPRALDAQAIKKAADAALFAAFKAVPLRSQGRYEDPVRLARVIREYSIWYDESAT